MVRRREYQDDVRDRQAEELENAELEKQTEELLQKQMQEMADLEAKQRAAGYLFDDSAHVKVAIGGPTGSAPAASKQKTNIAFNGDDDDDAGKKKRTLIMLDDAEGLTPAQRDERHNEKLRAIKDAIPSDQATLWASKIKWGVAITVSRYVARVKSSHLLSSRSQNRPKWKTRLPLSCAKRSMKLSVCQRRICLTLLSSTSGSKQVQSYCWKPSSRLVES